MSRESDTTHQRKHDRESLLSRVRARRLRQIRAQDAMLENHGEPLRAIDDAIGKLVDDEEEIERRHAGEPPGYDSYPTATDIEAVLVDQIACDEAVARKKAMPAEPGPEAIGRDPLADVPEHERLVAHALATLHHAREVAPDDVPRRYQLAAHLAYWALLSGTHRKGASEKTLDRALRVLLGKGGAVSNAIDLIKSAAAALNADARENRAFGVSERDDEYVAEQVRRVQRELAPYGGGARREQVQSTIESYLSVKPGRTRVGEKRTKRDERLAQSARLIGSESKAASTKRQQERAKARKKKSR